MADRELARRDAASMFGLGAGVDERYYEVVAIAVALMHDALKTFGKRAEGLADSWYFALKMRRVEISEIPPAAAAFVSEGDEFSTPNQFADMVSQIRSRRLTEECLRQISEEARREDLLRDRAYVDRLTLIYGDCHRKTVSDHFRRVSVGAVDRMRLRSRYSRPIAPAAVTGSPEPSADETAPSESVHTD